MILVPQKAGALERKQAVVVATQERSSESKSDIMLSPKGVNSFSLWFPKPELGKQCGDVLFSILNKKGKHSLPLKFLTTGN